MLPVDVVFEVESFSFSNRGSIYSASIYSAKEKVITHSYFFSFLVSSQASSVNDVQGIILHKPTKIKLLRATKLRRSASHYGDYIETF